MAAKMKFKRITEAKLKVFATTYISTLLDSHPDHVIKTRGFKALSKGKLEVEICDYKRKTKEFIIRIVLDELTVEGVRVSRYRLNHNIPTRPQLLGIQIKEGVE